MARQPRKQDLRKRLLKRRRPIQDPTIGFFARQGMNILCDGDACVIAGSVEEMNHILRQWHWDPSDYVIRATTFSEIHGGLKQGGAYCFNELSYSRFLAPAQAAEMQLQVEDFSDPGPTGVHLVRIELLDL